MTNPDIAAAFDEIADLLDIQGGDTFRVRAYRNVARIVTGFDRPVTAMLDEGFDLDTLPGIGADLAGKIASVARTGHCALLDQLREQVPAGLRAMLGLAGLGPKRVRTLHAELGVRTLEQLRDVARKQRIRTLPGFGPKTEETILRSVLLRLIQDRRTRIGEAAAAAEPLLAQLRTVPGVVHAEAAGSLRRMRETVGDLDIVLAAKRGAAAIEQFTRFEAVDRVLSKGGTRASVVLKGGLQMDLRAVAPSSFGAAWLYFTGSKAHNIALRRIAQSAGLKLNEYGLFRGAERIAGETEASVYRALGLSWIDPELREDRGEIEAARTMSLPALVRLDQLRGDLHVHTRAGIGTGTIEEMAQAARQAGLKYIAITDRSRHLGAAQGIDVEGLSRQIDRIDELNAQLGGLVLLKGVEADILEDGSLDFPDSLLSRLDVVVGAVHHGFDLPREKQTERLLRAMDNPHFHILAHPTGRVLDQRAPSDIDLVRVMRKARERGCFVELNAQPDRLDLDDAGCRLAKEEGVLVSIASGARGPTEFAQLCWGIGQARRGWLQADDVLNTRPAGHLRQLCKTRQGLDPAPQATALPATADIE